MSKEQEQLLQWIDESDNIVFFGGAGVSTESKIPDFRSVDGLYKQNYDYPPETILSHSFYIRNPEEFYRFYRDKMLFPDADPNAAHIALANLEKQGKLKAVITQNIDGLHQKAGSKEVLELHGSVLRNHCTHCHKFYSLEDILAMDGVPHCECGGIIKPDVVLYEEGLDMPLMERAFLCCRYFEGWHSEKHYPYVGWGHKLLPNEKYSARTMTKRDADELLRKDLRKFVAMFRKFGVDSILLGTLAYNVGPAKLLGSKTIPKSTLIKKLEAGDRNIYREYIAFCNYKGKRHAMLLKRRKAEFALLYIP